LNSGAYERGYYALLHGLFLCPNGEAVLTDCGLFAGLTNF